MLNVILFISAMLAVSIATLQVYPIFGRLRLPVLLSCLIYGCTILYCGALIPGILGFYTPLAVGMSLIAVSTVMIGFFWFGEKCLLSPLDLSIDQAKTVLRGKWTATTLVCLFAALMMLSPFLLYLANIPNSLVSPRAELNWDTVSYHLPGLVEFQQNQTLWSMNGPFQSYSFGFELIFGLSLLFFHLHWGIVVGSALALLLMACAVAYFVEQLAISLRVPDINVPVVQVLALGIFCSCFPDAAKSMGKNDLFVAACLLTTFALLLDSEDNDLKLRAFSRKAMRLMLASLALGLAIATKPPSFAFIPLFALLAGIADKSKWTLKSFHFKPAVLMISGALLLGSFFTFRNLLIFKYICDPGFGHLHGCLLRSLLNPDLYRWSGMAAMFLASFVTAPLLMMLRNICGKRDENSSKFTWTIAFYVTALVAFSLTPMGVSKDLPDPAPLILQNRKAMDMYAIYGCSIALVCGWLCIRFQSIRLSVGQTVALIAGVFCSSLGINAVCQQTWPIGMDGYEEIKGLARTHIYDWVQTQNSYHRIYCAGLRPYGVFGRELDNQVFYDLHSNVLDREGRPRLLKIMQEFHPDLLLISVDPHEYTGPAKKPFIVDWLRTQPCFKEVFSDDTVSGFAVKNGWRELLKEYAWEIPEKAVPMHG